MNKKIELYHYGDWGEFDDDNPFKVYSNDFIPEFLYLIGRSDPYTISLVEIANELNADKHSLNIQIGDMKALSMIDEKNGYFSTKFTIIVEEDLKAIDEFSKNTAIKLSKLIYSKKIELDKLCEELSSSKKFESDVLLYHIIGCKILDGSAIDTLGSLNQIRTSKEQIGDRNYILFGFEKSRKVDKFSEDILCSCNNYRTDNLSFVSFGDAAGKRNDFYRFGRQVVNQINKIETSSKTKQSYIKIMEKQNKEIGVQCEKVIRKLIGGNVDFSSFSGNENLYLNYLESFNYIERDTFE